MLVYRQLQQKQTPQKDHNKTKQNNPNPFLLNGETAIKKILILLFIKPLMPTEFSQPRESPQLVLDLPRNHINPPLLSSSAELEAKGRNYKWQRQALY